MCFIPVSNRYDSYMTWLGQTEKGGSFRNLFFLPSAPWCAIEPRP